MLPFILCFLLQRQTKSSTYRDENLPFGIYFRVTTLLHGILTENRLTGIAPAYGNRRYVNRYKPLPDCNSA